MGALHFWFNTPPVYYTLECQNSNFQAQSTIRSDYTIMIELLLELLC